MASLPAGISSAVKAAPDYSELQLGAWSTLPQQKVLEGQLQEVAEPRAGGDGDHLTHAGCVTGSPVPHTKLTPPQ